METVHLFLVAGSTIPLTLVVILQLSARAWRTDVGRSVLMVFATFALVVDLSVFFNVFGIDDYPGSDWIELGIYALLFTGSWYTLVVWYRLRRAALREAAEAS